jgi:hypothetical protein
MVNGNKINGHSQQAVISEALQMTGVNPHDVNYMELIKATSLFGRVSQPKELK